MKHTTNAAIITLAASVVLLATLACNVPTPRLGGPQAPAQAATPSADALASFNDKWRTLNLATPDGPFSITFTEAELTSALADAIQQAQTDQSGSVPIQDLQVVLSDSVINLYGQFQTGAFQAEGLIVAAPAIGPDGLVHIQVNSVEFGPLEVDPAVLEALVASIEGSINEPIQSSPFNITLTTITIASNQMTIDGTIIP